MSFVSGSGLSEETTLKEHRLEDAEASGGALNGPRKRETHLYLLAPLKARDLEGLSERLARMLADDEGCIPTLILEVRDLSGANGGIVDALARLQLNAKRLGSEIRLQHADQRLRGLIELCGLSDALPLLEGPLEPGGKPEQREQTLGVEEEDDPTDPVL